MKSNKTLISSEKKFFFTEMSALGNSHYTVFTFAKNEF